MEYVNFIGGKPIRLIFNELDEEIDLDELTRIDYGNIYGEAVTVSTLIAKLGIWRATVEEILNSRKLDLEVFQANLRKEIREENNKNQGVKINETVIKLTEAMLDDLTKGNLIYQEKKTLVITAKRQYDIVDAIFWAVSSKEKKLNNLVKTVTPEELYQELVEGAINGIMIKKTEIKYNLKS